MNTFKILAVAVALTFGAVSVNAQKDKTFSFIDAAGNEVADGSSLVFYAAKTEKMPGYPMFGYNIAATSGLKIRNNSNSDAKVTARVITSASPKSGVAKICITGTQCITKAGDFFTKEGSMAAKKVEELHVEWLFDEKKPDVYCEEQETLTIYSGANKLEGPTISIRWIYADPTGITDIESADNATEVARYDLNGRKLTAPQKGLNIIKLSNGKTVKKLIK